MNIDKERLKALAETVQTANAAYLDDECNHALHEALIDADDRFMEAAAPEVVLALLAEIDALRAKLENPDPILIQCLDAAITEQDQLEKDAARYQWLCAQFGVTKLPCAIERILGGEAYVADGKASIDAAIDAALAKEVQP